MPRILRNLKIEDVSSVDRGAGRGVRVVLAKRDAGKALLAQQAVEALNASVASIVADDGLADKRGAIDESVRQFQDYAKRHGIDPATVADAVAKLGDGPGSGDWQEEDDMSSKYVCPECGHVADKGAFKDAAAGYDDDEDGTSKRLDLGTIRKAAAVTHDSIVKHYREKMPAATEAQVLAAATSSAEYQELHRAERNAALRSSGHL